MDGPSTEVGIVRTDKYNVYVNETNGTYNGSTGDTESSDYTYLDKYFIIRVVIYGLMFILSAVCNIHLLITLIKNRKRKSRLNFMFLHLVISDLIVTIFVIPLQITLHLPVQWVVDNAACKILLWMRAFGLNILSSVLASISLDIYYSFQHPLEDNDAQRRSKIMLIVAWATSILSSMAQVRWF
ncbi:gonadotropin-releasing hormone II receptor [Trichonephila clavipes]|nr:gonadotropin-releasing hormone II receptor [Trichonephila clavipes]